MMVMVVNPNAAVVHAEWALIVVCPHGDIVAEYYYPRWGGEAMRGQGIMEWLMLDMMLPAGWDIRTDLLT